MYNMWPFMTFVSKYLQKCTSFYLLLLRNISKHCAHSKNTTSFNVSSIIKICVIMCTLSLVHVACLLWFTWTMPMSAFVSSPSQSVFLTDTFFSTNPHYFFVALCLMKQSSGAVWKSRWSSWAFRPNEPYGFRGCKAMLNHAHALVSACP